jgi:hypothetical protein
MRTSKFSETQIVAILKEADAGAKVKDICRKYGISDATYYRWKSKARAVKLARFAYARRVTGRRVGCSEVLGVVQVLNMPNINIVDLQGPMGAIALKLRRRGDCETSGHQKGGLTVVFNDFFEGNKLQSLRKCDFLPRFCSGFVRMRDTGKILERAIEVCADSPRDRITARLTIVERLNCSVSPPSARFR